VNYIQSLTQESRQAYPSKQTSWAHLGFANGIYVEPMWDLTWGPGGTHVETTYGIQMGYIWDI